MAARSEQRTLSLVLVRFCAAARQQRGGCEGRPDAPARYGGDLSIGELDLEALRLPRVLRTPERSLRLIAHEREAARQHAAIAHRAEELLLENEIAPQALQPLVVGANHAGGETLDRRHLLAAPPGEQRRLADEHP